jgi:hypothetical protein
MVELHQLLPSFKHYFTLDAPFKNDRELCSFFDQRHDLWRNGNIKPPRSQPPIIPSQRFDQLKILFLFPKYMFPLKCRTRCAYKDIFVSTAQAVGMNAEEFYTDAISYPSNPGPHEPQLLERLRKQFFEQKPDIVFFDANYIGDDTTINSDFINKLRGQGHAKFIGFVGDAWDHSGWEVSQYWAEACDLILHCAPAPNEGMGAGGALGLPTNSLMIPLPVNKQLFHGGMKKCIDLAFSGTLSTGLRSFWLPIAMSEARRQSLNTQLGAYERQLGEALDDEEYSKTMRNARIVLNFSSRAYLPQPTKALTGRAWQAIASGALLLEEDNEPIKAFFIPYVHYVPFRTVGELRVFIRFFARNEEYRRRIAKNGMAQIEHHYSNELIWSIIVAKLKTSSNL